MTVQSVLVSWNIYLTMEGDTRALLLAALESTTEHQLLYQGTILLFEGLTRFVAAARMLVKFWRHEQP